MLEPQSPLGAHAQFEGAGIRIAEIPGVTLTQIAGEEKDLKKALGKLPGFGSALELDGRLLLRVGPSQVWVIGEAPASKTCFLTPLSSGRLVLKVEGIRARELLSACAAVDFSPEAFGAGTVAMTGIHHTPVLIHCADENEFSLYVMRSFAHSVWDWLCDVATGWAT